MPGMLQPASKAARPAPPAPRSNARRETPEPKEIEPEDIERGPIERGDIGQDERWCGRVKRLPLSRSRRSCRTRSQGDTDTPPHTPATVDAGSLESSVFGRRPPDCQRFPSCCRAAPTDALACRSDNLP